MPQPAENATKITARQPAAAGDRPELTEATIVVAGGRGVGSADNFSVVEELADSLGAAVGCLACRGGLRLLPGTVPGGPDRQDRVAAAVHRAGHLRGDPAPRRHADVSKTIVAVNKDEEAPIFEISDYGIVGDLFKVAPQLTEAIKARKG